VAAAVALLLIVGAWWYASPLWTLHEMQSAARKGDAKELSEYIDYPAVRESLKSQFRRQLLQEAAKSKEGGFAALGSAFALALVNPVLDATVTPEGMEAAFAHRNLVPAEAGPKLPNTPSDPVVHREGLSHFTVSDKDPNKGSLLFERSGLGWKLVGFELPPTSPNTAKND
jgi:hypothetical protein